MLTNAVDAADPLFEPARIPRQLQVHHDPAVVMEVQPFRRCIRCEQHDLRRRREPAKRVGPFLSAQAAVQHDCRATDAVEHVQQRVAVFGEHDNRLARASQELGEAPQLRLLARRVACRREQRSQQPPLAIRIRERKRRRPGWRLIGVDQLPRRIAERQHQLLAILGVVCARDRLQPAIDRLRERPGARQHALVQHAEREQRVAAAKSAVFRAHGARILHQPRVHAALRWICRHQRDVHLLEREIAQQILERLGLRHKQGRAHQRPNLKLLHRLAEQLE